MFVVCVTFEIDPNRLNDFLPLMAAQARNSLTLEDGCHLFDVSQDPDTASHVFLYEVYEDKAAFDIHLASDHFKTFDTAVAPMVLSKSVSFLNRMEDL